MSLLMDALKVADDRKKSIISLSAESATASVIIDDEHTLNWEQVELQPPSESNSSKLEISRNTGEWELSLLEELETADTSKTEQSVEQEVLNLEENSSLTDFGSEDDLLAEYQALQQTTEFQEVITNTNDTIDLVNKSTVLTEKTEETVITPLPVFLEQAIDVSTEIVELDWDEAIKPNYPDSELDELLGIVVEKSELSFLTPDPNSLPAQRVLAAGGGKPKISKRVKWLYALAVLTFIVVVGGIGGIYYQTLNANVFYIKPSESVAHVAIQPPPDEIAPAVSPVIATESKPASATTPVATHTITEPIKSDSLLPKSAKPESVTQSVRPQKQLVEDTTKKSGVTPSEPKKVTPSESKKTTEAPVQKPVVATAPPVAKTFTVQEEPPHSLTVTPLLHKGTTQQKNRTISEAYQAFQQDRNEVAQKLYREVLHQDAKNRDALLGLAAIAARHGQTQQARYYYQQVLQFYPQDTLAQMGLHSIQLTQTPQLKESQLKSLVEQLPEAAELHFDLGNFYATAQQWSAAQQAYFNAYRLDKKQADYAYNLAISLDHLNQPRLALTYYQEALKLVENQSITSYHFDLQAIQRRIQTLLAYRNTATD